MYKKLIISGNTTELYEYQYQPNLQRFESKHAFGSLEGDRRRFESEKQRLERRQDNATRAKVAFRRIVQANLVGGEKPILGTFTFEKEKQISEGYKCFNLFARRLRKRYGSCLKYIAVPEYGTRNTQRLHFHSLIWGIPVEHAKRERKTRDIASLWKNGFIDLELTDGSPKLATYLTKYLVKAYQNPRLFDRNSYVTSRNIFKPIVFSDFISLYFQYVDPVDNQLVYSKVYDTVYLGQCNYKVYNNNTNEN